MILKMLYVFTSISFSELCILGKHVLNLPLWICWYHLLCREKVSQSLPHHLNRMSYIIYVVVDGLVTMFLQACLILCSRDHDFTLTAQICRVRVYSFDRSHSCSTGDTTEDEHPSPNKHRVAQRCKGISIIIELWITSLNSHFPHQRSQHKM